MHEDNFAQGIIFGRELEKCRPRVRVKGKVVVKFKKNKQNVKKRLVKNF